MTNPAAVDLDKIVSLADLEPIARERLRGPAFDYVAGGSWEEITLAKNDVAWRRFQLVPLAAAGRDGIGRVVGQLRGARASRGRG